MYNQKTNRYLKIIFLLMLIWAVSACGGGDAPPAEKEANTANEAPASETTEETEEAPAAETEPAAESAETTAEMRTPTTLAQAAKAIDFKTLPRLDEAEVAAEEVGELRYAAPAAVAEALDFYKAELSKLDWQQVADSEYSNEEYAQAAFTKNDYYLSLSVTKSYSGQEGFIEVALLNHGNVDVRALPKYADAESLGGDTQMTLVYFTPATVAEVADFTRTELAALGWQEYIRPNTAYAEDPNTQTLTFKQNASALTAYITVAPAQDGKTSAQYSVVLLNNDLPVIADADKIEFDDFQTFLGYTTPADFAAVIDFYRQEMSARGWEEITDIGAETPEQVALFFTDEVQPVTLLLTPTDDGQTQVVVRAFDADELAALTSPDADTPETEIVEADENELIEDESMADDSSGAPNIPVPNDAQEVKYDANAESITFTSPATIDEVVTFYRDTLAADGWTEDEDFSSVDESFGLLFFEKGDASLDLTVFGGFGDGLDVTVSTSGLTWAGGGSSTDVESEGEPEANAEMSIDEWPIPDEATEVKVRSDEVEYVIDWDFKQVADFYAPVYEEMNMTLDCFDEEDLATYSSISCSTGNGTVSVSLNLFSNFDNETEVLFYLSGFAPSEAGEAGSGGADSLTEEDGVPVPSDFDKVSSESTEFRSLLSGASEGDLTSLVELYRTELATQGWQEQTDAAEISEVQATLKFESDEQILDITLTPTAEGTELTLLQKSPQAAKAMGILPPSGQARIYLGSFNEADVSLTIDKHTLTVPPSAPDDQPEDMLFLDLKPGEYKYTLDIPGEGKVEDVITVGADESWVLAIGPGGAFAIQSY